MQVQLLDLVPMIFFLFLGDDDGNDTIARTVLLQAMQSGSPSKTYISSIVHKTFGGETKCQPCMRTYDVPTIDMHGAWRKRRRRGRRSRLLSRSKIKWLLHSFSSDLLSWQGKKGIKERKEEGERRKKKKKKEKRFSSVACSDIFL